MASVSEPGTGIRWVIRSSEAGGGSVKDAVRRGSRACRSSNWQKGQGRADVSVPPNASRNSLPHREHDAKRKLAAVAIHRPSVCAARSKARSKLMRSGALYIDW